MRLPFSFWLFLVGLVLVELAVLVPVIVTQKARDESSVTVELQMATDDLTVRLQKTIATFMYSVVRAAAAAPMSGFLSQQALEDAIQPEEDPNNTPGTLYAWVPLVNIAERVQYEQFYGFNITYLSNGTLIPYEVGQQSIFGGDFFAPYTIFVPGLPPPPLSNPFIYGFDLFSSVSISPLLQNNVSQFLVAPSSMISRTQNNYGIIAFARNMYNKGYMLGRVGSQELVEFSLIVPRRLVTLAAFVVSTNASRQALFYDNSPLLGNATNLTLFNALPARAEFVVSNFSSFGQVIMVAVRYDASYAAQFVGNTWVILASVLVPVCFLIDVICVILALLWQRRKELLILEQSKRQELQLMVGYVNHEIRNPLQTILGLADMHLEQAEKEKNHCLASDLGTIIGAAEFIEHIATDILDMRRVEEGKVDIEKSEIDILRLMSSLEKAVIPLLAKKTGIELKVEIDQQIQRVRTDLYRLQQILLNFLTNAFKHTDEGVITLSASLTNLKWIRFAVWDTGKGIASEKKDIIFRQFAQVSSKDASDLGGFGLGLYLTRMLAQLLGGSVGFESTVGVGSVFWVDLPAEEDSMSLLFQFQESDVPLHN
jgi:signal transduction histidine kinase